MKLSTRTITMGAILAAMAVSLKFLSLSTLGYRFTFYGIPLMISGILFGPFVGGTVGFITDWIYATYHGYPIGLFTISSILWGLIPGLFFLVFKNVNIKTITVTVIITSVLCFLANTYASYYFYGLADVIANLPARIITMIVKWPIQVFVLNKVYSVIVHLNLKRA